uniref:Dynein heavy chain C-terminal domain-containing protein n=1 Tax=Corethron hystrix TaxID=216773 RepID=A0A7S1C210_9STRA
MNSSRKMWTDLISLQPQVVEGSNGISIEAKISDIAMHLLSKIPIISLETGTYDLSVIRSKLLANNKNLGNSSLSPCQVVLLQELDRWNIMCICIVRSLQLLLDSISGSIGMSDNIESVSHALYNGIVPEEWARHAPPTKMRLASWTKHLSARHEQYESWISGTGDPRTMWLGGLHVPESYLTALVQKTCQKRGWPLDRSTVYSYVTNIMEESQLPPLSKEAQNDEDGCFIRWLYLEGAGWDKEKGHLVRQDPKCLVTELPLLRVVPVERSKMKKSKNTFRTPVYTTTDRRNAAGAGMVFEADMAVVDHSSHWILQGVALLLNLSD